MTTGDLWRSVHAALDERRDPLADEAVLAALEQHPEALAEVADLAQRLALLRGARDASRSRPRTWWLAAACAAGLLSALSLWTLRSTPPAAERARAPIEHAPRSSRSRVLSYRVSIDHSGARGRITSTSAAQAGEFTRQARFELQPPTPRAYAPLPLTTVIVRNLTRNQP